MIPTVLKIEGDGVTPQSLSMAEMGTVLLSIQHAIIAATGEWSDSTPVAQYRDIRDGSCLVEMDLDAVAQAGWDRIVRSTGLKTPGSDLPPKCRKHINAIVRIAQTKKGYLSLSDSKHKTASLSDQMEDVGNPYYIEDNEYRAFVERTGGTKLPTVSLRIYDLNRSVDLRVSKDLAAWFGAHLYKRVSIAGRFHWDQQKDEIVGVTGLVPKLLEPGDVLAILNRAHYVAVSAAPEGIEHDADALYEWMSADGESDWDFETENEELV